MSIPREQDATIHILKMTHDPAYREAHKHTETIASQPRQLDSKAKARSDLADMCSEIRKSKSGESSELDKATLHLLKMKYDLEYAAEYNAGTVDIQKAFHSVDGVTHEDSAELQKMAAVLATMEIAGSPEEKIRLMRGYLDGTL